MKPTGTYVIGHCVGVMATHGVSQGVVFANFSWNSLKF